MDLKVLYWTGAFINFGLISALAYRGVRQIRRGEVARHRRSMSTCAVLVGAFLVSYGFKLRFLGREDLGVWSDFHVGNLRIHETCVLAMLAAGIVAITRARKMRDTRSVTRDPASPPAPASTVRWHQRAGWTSVVSAGLGLLTAATVLFGMYSRL
ncbi:MAG: DUF420 domain-containing protein [Myxococcota bacterium]|nr:DUF420 domain-containing protein [Myxococcota bacterium]